MSLVRHPSSTFFTLSLVSLSLDQHLDSLERASSDLHPPTLSQIHSRSSTQRNIERFVGSPSFLSFQSDASTRRCELCLLLLLLRVSSVHWCHLSLRLCLCTYVDSGSCLFIPLSGLFLHCKTFDFLLVFLPVPPFDLPSPVDSSPPQSVPGFSIGPCTRLQTPEYSHGNRIEKAKTSSRRVFFQSGLNAFSSILTTTKLSRQSAVRSFLRPAEGAAVE